MLKNDGLVKPSNCFINWLAGPSYEKTEIRIMSVLLKTFAVAGLTIGICAAAGVLPSVAISASGVGLAAGQIICVTIKVILIKRDRDLDCSERCEMFVHIASGLTMGTIGSLALAQVVVQPIPTSIFSTSVYYLFNLAGHTINHYS